MTVNVRPVPTWPLVVLVALIFCGVGAVGWWLGGWALRVWGVPSLVRFAFAMSFVSFVAGVAGRVLKRSS